jgi:predicted choloylglycine hydrolase
MDIYQPKDEYLALFGELKNAGIIVTNSSEFESILQNRINTEDWLSEEVQDVRDKFCYYFAYTSKIWRNMNSHAIRKNLT